MGEPSAMPSCIGNTLVFKAALVRRLVGECHYDAFMIESGIYDFLNIARRLRAREPVSDSMLAAAIGGVWANQEVSALVPFLLENARRGRLTLAGLDDQLGAGTWAQREMPEELVRELRAPTRCVPRPTTRPSRSMLRAPPDASVRTVHDADCRA